MKKNITSLEELEEEQKKLKIKMELARQAFVKSLGTNRDQAKDFLIKNVALTGGAIGLGFAAVKTVASMSGDKKEQRAAKESSAGILEKVLPLAVGFAQAYFFKKMGKEEDNNKTSATGPESNSQKHPLKKVV